MGEIKSTLEIIMEKTKDMTLTEDEKRELKHREIQGKVGGIIQKLMDGITDIEECKMEVAALAKDKQELIMQVVMDEAVPRITLGEDNTTIMKVFEVTDGIDASVIRECLDKTNQEIAEKRRKQEKEMGIRLRERGVSGSAVIPNPDADPDWIDYVKAKESQLKDEIGSAARTKAS